MTKQVDILFFYSAVFYTDFCCFVLMNDLRTSTHTHKKKVILSDNDDDADDVLSLEIPP